MIDFSNFDIESYLDSKRIDYDMQGKNISSDWIGITCVFPGILPPIIKTTPNSPSVCAKLNIMAVIIPFLDNGIIILKNDFIFENCNICVFLIIF